MGTAVNIKAFLMQEQGDCSPLTLTQEFSSVFKLIFWVRPPPPGSSPGGGGGGGGGGELYCDGSEGGGQLPPLPLPFGIVFPR